MSLTLSLLEFLQTDAATLTLANLAQEDLSEKHTLSLLTQLRRTHNAEEAGALLSQARLRQKAHLKFGELAAEMFFTPDALEQASDPHIRQYRAALINDLSQPVYDMGCATGSDSIALARAGLDVTGLDIDPVRIAIARHNAQVHKSTAKFEVADIRDIQVTEQSTVFFDPARRDANGKRLYDVEQYQPPLSLIKQWRSAGQIIVKLSPGVDLSQLEEYAGSVEFISVQGALKEAVLSVPSQFTGFRATRLDDEGIHHFMRETEITIMGSEPRNWLIEPDPAIIRAGLVQDLAVKFDGTMLDDQIAYFTTDTKPASPWVRAWKILDWMPYHLKKLRAYLRERQVSTITVKKRGSRITPEELISRLKLKTGAESRTLVLTRLNNQPIVLICEDITA